MREIVLYIAATLDGFIADENGGIDFLKPFEDTGEDYGYTELMSSLQAVVMGSRTYEQILGFDTPWMYPGLTTYVCTQRQLPTNADPGIRLWHGSVTELMEELPHGRTWLIGGGQLIDSFNAAGLVDRLQLAIIPVFLGRGIKLLSVPPAQQKLILQSVKNFPSGLVMLDYRLQKTT